MKTRQEYIQILTEHIAELAEKFGVRSLILFGSVARDEHHEGSDVDVFVDMPPKFFLACAAADYLEEILGCKVDLVRNNKNISDFFRKQVMSDGIQIFPAAGNQVVHY